MLCTKGFDTRYRGYFIISLLCVESESSLRYARLQDALIDLRQFILEALAVNGLEARGKAPRGKRFSVRLGRNGVLQPFHDDAFSSSSRTLRSSIYALLRVIEGVLYVIALAKGERWKRDVE